MQVNLQVSEAGPSKGPRHQASLSQSSTKDLPPTPISPTIHGRPTHVQAIHDFNPLLLASAAGSTSSANMYLPFKAGEIIRVHVRDTTGWWDGEISVVDAEEEARKGPRRGWFPSNYVREMGVDGVSTSWSVGSLSRASPPIAEANLIPNPRRLPVPNLATNRYLQLITGINHPLRITVGYRVRLTLRPYRRDLRLCPSCHNPFKL